MYKIGFLTILLICTTSCTVGVDYKRPCIDTPNHYRYAKEEVNQWVNMAWWHAFQDPVLDELIAQALVNNKDIKIATANIDQAVGNLMTIRSALFPQLNYNASAMRNFFSANIATPEPTVNPFNNFQVLAGASWEIDLWGRIRRQTESAHADILASIQARRGVILSLVSELASAYIELCALDEQKNIANKTLQALKESVIYFELQNKHGQVSQITVEQARAEYETVASSLPEIDIQIAKTENAISVLIGKNPSSTPRGHSIYQLNMIEVPSDLPSQLLEQRPDILQAEQQLRAANAEVGAAKAQYFPTLSLTGTYGQASASLSNLFKGGSRTWNYGGSLTGPIFTAGAIEGQVVQATAAKKAALSAYELTIIKAFSDVSNALVSLTEINKQLLAEENRVKAYQKYKDLAWLKYNGGYSPYLEVLYAQSKLYPSQLKAVQTKAATLISVINIYKALGGGWVNKADNLTSPKCSEK